jgi:hypothetical protein
VEAAAAIIEHLRRDLSPEDKAESILATMAPALKSLIADEIRASKTITNDFVKATTEWMTNQSELVEALEKRIAELEYRADHAEGKAGY